MTATTPLTLLKSQLNLDHDLDDELLAHKLGAAESWIGNYTGTPFAHFFITQASYPEVTEAALQLAAYWYEVRETGSDVTLRPVPFGVYELLAPHKEAVTGYVE